MSKIAIRVEKLPWHKKLQVLLAIEGWSQSEAALKYGTMQKQVWNWLQGKHYPIKIYRRAIAQAHGLDESDIFEGLKGGKRCG